MYYKNVRKLADGRRVSQFVDSEEAWPWGKMLTYKTGRITAAPLESVGIYCYDSLESAIDKINGNTCILFTGVVETHEAYPIGKPSNEGIVVRFPAIKLGKIVARHTVYEGYTHEYKRLEVGQTH